MLDCDDIELITFLVGPILYFEVHNGINHQGKKDSLKRNKKMSLEVSTFVIFYGFPFLLRFVTFWSISSRYSVTFISALIALKKFLQIISIFPFHLNFVSALSQLYLSKCFFQCFLLFSTLLWFSYSVFHTLSKLCPRIASALFYGVFPFLFRFLVLNLTQNCHIVVSNLVYVLQNASFLLIICLNATCLFDFLCHMHHPPIF